MASTTLTDLDFQTQAFSDVFAGEFDTQMAAHTSGVVAPVPNGLALNQGGQYINVPQYDNLDYSGTTKVSAASSAATIGSNGTWKSYMPLSAREQVWGSEFLVSAMSTLDPAAEIARQVARWSADVVSYFASQSVAGAFATALNSSHNYTGAGSINLEDCNRARKLLGDMQSSLTQAIMHGYVHADAINDGIIDTLAGSNGASDMYRSGVVDYLLGAKVSMDDLFCAAVSSVYPTYFAAPGSVLFHTTDVKASSVTAGFIDNITGPNGIKIQLERFRSQVGGGTDAIAARINLAVGVKGLEWQSTANPDPADLATGSNWAVSTGCPNKLIKIVRVTNITNS